MCGSSGTGIGRKLKEVGRKVDSAVRGAWEDIGDATRIGKGGEDLDKYVREPIRETREATKNAEKVQVAEANAAAKAKQKEFARVMQAAMLARRKRSAVSTGGNTMLGGGSSQTGKSLLGS